MLNQWQKVFESHSFMCTKSVEFTVLTVVLTPTHHWALPTSPSSFVSLLLCSRHPHLLYVLPICQSCSSQGLCNGCYFCRKRSLCHMLTWLILLLSTFINRMQAPCKDCLYHCSISTALGINAQQIFDIVEPVIEQITSLCL